MKNYKFSTDKTIYMVETTSTQLLLGSDKRFHYFYKIVNLKNNKYYYGVHSTKNINDGYSGSGVLLNTAYKKYGIENFIKYVLYFFSDRNDLLNYEKMVVNKELLKNKECYNLTEGGKGDSNIFHPNNYILHTTKGLIHINDGIKNKLVKKCELDKYLNNGWSKGQTIQSTKGRIVVHKEKNFDKFIEKEELEKYLLEGWKIGGKSRNKNTNFNSKNTVWINNKEKSKRVNKEELEKYLSEGWLKGPLQKSTKGYVRITNGIEDKNIPPEDIDTLNSYINNGWKRGSHVKRNNIAWITKDKKSIVINKEELEKYLSEGWKNTRIVKTNNQKGKIAIYKNDVIKYINKEELEKYLSEGWKRGNITLKGNLFTKNRIRINNGICSKMINKEELEKYLSEGWKRGNLNNSNTKGRIRINNGIVEKFISKNDFSNYDKSIWKRGLIKPRKNKG